MRWIPLVLAVLGLAAGITLPFFWASAAPVWLGAALLVVAGALSRRLVPAAAALVAAVVLVLAPGLVNGYRNGQGIAWAVPAGERLELAQEGLAVTRTRSGLRGRDLRTGERRWDLRLPEGDGDVRVWRIDDRLIVNWSDDILRAVGVDDGRERWQAVPLDTQLVGVTDGEHVAVTRCSGFPQCEIQSLSLETGLVVWRADITGTGDYLGVPMPDRGAPQRALAPWRASFVLVGDDERWQARDLATGRVLETGSHQDGSTAIHGDVLVRSTDDGALRATNVQTGEELWSRPPGDGRASLSPIVSTDTLALPEGVLVLSGDGYATDSIRLGERLRTLNTLTGEERTAKLDTGHGLVEVLGSERPRAKRPVVLARDYEEDGRPSKIAADGRTYAREDVRDVHVTADRIGFESDGHTWGTGRGRVIEVFDRRSGKRLVRHAAQDADIRTQGDALVISEGSDEELVQRVVSP
ncbi:putative pyrroloquinoline-quinone binding quinoprotein [Solirubrobacter pauli]|uniref:Putative pyrroloquinoline-quinone binding quinoprotein n=1 Tax=Solirubrobacter pauli TaxID=166793 RepID=A0A660LBI4_9ACTN|nr:PQQ-binding-like beta-propeller repeat protein [Solirubrobacter pauli]RKQ91585.1 putative pyrroloquinoline-quinone binding quinoprotein [Solirubrobacter pauli]